jgi:hypothetical protein
MVFLPPFPRSGGRICIAPVSDGTLPHAKDSVRNQGEFDADQTGGGSPEYQ